MTIKENDEWNSDKILEDIESKISQHVVDDISLFYGKSGICIFYFEMFRHFGTPAYLGKCEKLIDEIVGALKDRKTDYTISRGLAGTAWALDFLSSRGVEIDTQYKADIDALLYINSLRALMNRSVGYFDGSLGTVLYAANRLPDDKATGFLYQYVAVIKSKMNQNLNLPPWDYFDSISKDSSHSYPTTLESSVGVSDLANILTTVFKRDFLKNEIPSLVDRALTWLTSVHATDDAYGQKAIHANPVLHSGILRIAWTFWKAGVVFKQASWKSRALLLVDTLVQLSNKTEKSMLDASLLTGTSGIAHLFNRFYHETGDDRYLFQYLYWSKITLDKVFDNKRQDEKQSRLSFNKIDVEKPIETMAGIAGFGMTILSKNNITRFDWDECLLIT
ncbi:MAG TPA: lanthionine synthetase LanC family protein [Cyclobacteriaceae bacterium]|nr:lanthionine synthetase LanC family protein [Cyclobacteriaceae bacterium]